MDELNKLRDIKTITPIELFNPIWIVVAIVVVIVILLALYFLTKRPKRKRFKLTPKELAMQRVQNIDYSDAKSVAYIFSKDLAHFIDESNSKQYLQLEKELEPYKYKKDIPKLDKDLENRVKEFIKGIKWKI